MWKKQRTEPPGSGRGSWTTWKGLDRPAELPEKDTLQPVELPLECAVHSRFPEFMSCHSQWGGLWWCYCLWVISAPVSDSSCIVVVLMRLSPVSAGIWNLSPQMVVLFGGKLIRWGFVEGNMSLEAGFESVKTCNLIISASCLQCQMWALNFWFS